MYLLMHWHIHGPREPRSLFTTIIPSIPERKVKEKQEGKQKEEGKQMKLSKLYLSRAVEIGQNPGAKPFSSSLAPL